MNVIEYDKFHKALEHLERQHEHYGTLDEDQPELIREGIAESVIHRFETCYDCMWKVLRRYLIDELGIPEVPGSPKKVIRLAGENELFASSTEQWLKYADARIATSHDYSGEKATNALELIADFIDDAIGLYQTMSGETWE